MANTNPYKAEIGFRYKLLALMLDNLWMGQYGDSIILPEYFDTDSEESIAKGIIDFRSTYGRSPDDPDDLILLVGEDFADEVYKIYDISEQQNLDFVADNALRFAKERSVKLAILASVDDIERGDHSKLIKRMEEALAVGSSLAMPGIDPISDIDSWLHDYWSAKIRTGMVHIDRVLEGGLAPGELGVILAPQNRGKSMSLISIGYGATSLGSGKNVVHFVHEMSESQTAKRYASRILFRFPKRGDDLDKYADDLIHAARKVMRGKVRIIGGRMSILDMDNRINILKSEGFVPDLIVDDYGDLIVPARTYSDKRHELSGIYEDLRELGRKHNCPVWTASQSNRSSHSKEIITMQDIAEDIGKTSIADVIISVCQTKEEWDSDLCRLYMAKVRDGRNHSIFAAKYYSSQQAIITIGDAKNSRDSETYA